MTGSSLPQRMVLMVAILVVAGVVAALSIEWVAGADRPSEPAVSVAEIRQLQDSRWVVDVEATNTGEATAAQVQVIAEVVLPDGRTESGEQVIDLLAPGEVVDLAFTFSVEPAEDDVLLRVASHAQP